MDETLVNLLRNLISTNLDRQDQAPLYDSIMETPAEGYLGVLVKVLAITKAYECLSLETEEQDPDDPDSERRTAAGLIEVDIDTLTQDLMRLVGISQYDLNRIVKDGFAEPPA